MDKKLGIESAKVGDRIKFTSEKQSYKVQARSDRYLVCTKPFNPRKTVLYTIVDLDNKVRGPENLIFGAGQETREQCEETILRLHGLCRDTGFTSEISYRNRIALDFERLIKAKGEQP